MIVDPPFLGPRASVFRPRHLRYQVSRDGCVRVSFFAAKSSLALLCMASPYACEDQNLFAGIALLNFLAYMV